MAVKKQPPQREVDTPAPDAPPPPPALDERPAGASKPPELKTRREIRGMPRGKARGLAGMRRVKEDAKIAAQVAAQKEANRRAAGIIYKDMSAAERAAAQAKQNAFAQAEAEKPRVRSIDVQTGQPKKQQPEPNP